RDRLVREDPDPDVAAAFHEARHRAARRLDLSRREIAALERLEAVLAERDAVAALREPAIAALELLPELGSLWLHHGRLLSRASRALLLRTRSVGGFFARSALGSGRPHH